MILEAKFTENNSELVADFGKVFVVDSGGGDYRQGYDDGFVAGESFGWTNGYDSGYVVGYETGKGEGGGGIDTTDATATADHIDYGQTAYVNGEKITGTKHRREYSGKIESEVCGASACTELLQDDLLAEMRTLDTLFVRVECYSASFLKEETRKYTIAKNWASNTVGETLPLANAQVSYRYGSSGTRNYGNMSNRLCDEPTSSTVGLLHITDDGKLLFYSGSPNYKIIPCDFKVIVEW